ncbi:winged helix DNA-binding protein [Microvirga massiliensis]|uniref:winged helix DNA-binding protein n=1 Tax=Microvirga massiliensis TaxID=1033741 RepID=UPI00062B9016|nr:winged helix DNA-binding protein [Microvirga massiliensis]
MSGIDLEEGMERISLADLSPRDAIPVFRQLLETAPEVFPARAYAALSAATLRILTARQTTELRDWTDLIRQASAQARSLSSPVFGQQLLALSDLTSAWTRLSEAHPTADILERPHCRAILEELRRQDGTALRRDIIAAVGIGEANLSRILGSLEAVGLIRRNNRRVRTITLTAEGERLLRQSRTEAPPRQSPSRRSGTAPGRPERTGRPVVPAAEPPFRRAAIPGVPRGMIGEPGRLAAHALPEFEAVKADLLRHASVPALEASATATDDDRTALHVGQPRMIGA